MKKIIILCAAVILFSLDAATSYAQVGVGIQVQVAPPELPVSDQPECPGDGYMWTPGYWAYGYDGYYWVPGVWVLPPAPGLLWTPSYWAFSGGYYGWHAGYWGEHVGFYGGLNYGHGYWGEGFGGGRWEGGRFRYNTAVMNVNTTVIHNTYVDRTVIRTSRNNRTSYNGPGGTSARPTTFDEVAARDRHVTPTEQQTSHQENAIRARSQFATVNHGSPPTRTVRTVRPENNVPATSSVPRSDFERARNPASPTVNPNPGRPERPAVSAPQQHVSQQQPHMTPQRQQPQRQAQPRPAAPRGGQARPHKN